MVQDETFCDDGKFIVEWDLLLGVFSKSDHEDISFLLCSFRKLLSPIRTKSEKFISIQLGKVWVSQNQVMKKVKVVDGSF